MKIFVSGPDVLSEKISSQYMQPLRQQNHHITLDWTVFEETGPVTSGTKHENGALAMRIINEGIIPCDIFIAVLNGPPDNPHSDVFSELIAALALRKHCIAISPHQDVYQKILVTTSPLFWSPDVKHFPSLAAAFPLINALEEEQLLDATMCVEQELSASQPEPEPPVERMEASESALERIRAAHAQVEEGLEIGGIRLT